ncbi:MAG: hypothetical protein ACRC2R_00590 [Xenococcaceae cyanobacterium]
MNESIGKRLEQYTIKRSQEILLVTVEIGEQQDRVLIFKGFSSSLVNPTAFDPDVPVITDTATIISIDRIASPYNPENPRYLQQGLSLEQMKVLLLEVNV